MSGTPNPGSGAARVLGCTCAVLDNNHGKYPPHPPDGWWVTEGCPIHTQEGSEKPVRHYEGFGRWNSRMCGVCWKPWPCPTKLEADKRDPHNPEER